jgi:hypothetical protein
MMKILRLNIFNLILTLLLVCFARQSAALESPQDLKAKPSFLDGWSKETFPLPPDFAPKLPKGTESLRFPPGWRKPGDEGFWSYAFVMWIEESTPTKRRIEGLLETYYNGLLTMFAQAKKKDISSFPVRITVTRKGRGKYEAHMLAMDAFATFKPIKVRLDIESAALGRNRSTLQIKLSPQPRNHPIWKSLEVATADILARNQSLGATR